MPFLRNEFLKILKELFTMTQFSKIDIDVISNQLAKKCSIENYWK